VQRRYGETHFLNIQAAETCGVFHNFLSFAKAASQRTVPTSNALNVIQAWKVGLFGDTDLKRHGFVDVKE